MICEVMFKCGHVRTVDVTGQADERKRKIAYYARMQCPECRCQQAAKARVTASVHVRASAP